MQSTDTRRAGLLPVLTLVLSCGLPLPELLAQDAIVRPATTYDALDLQLPVAEVAADDATSGASLLPELEALALANHPLVQRAAAQVRMAEGRAIQARLWPNPELGASSPQLAGSESQYNVFVSQDILTGGKLRLASSAEWQAVQRERHMLMRTRFDVLTEVRQQFYTTLADQYRVDVLQRLRDITRLSRDMGQAKLDAGESNLTDLLLLEVEAEKSELALQNAQASLLANQRRLAAIVGLPYLEIARLQADLAEQLPAIELVELQAGAVGNNSNVAMAQADIGRSQFQLERARVEPRPTFNVMGGYQYQPIPIQDQAIFQVTMSVPVWNRNQGGIREAQAGVQHARAELRRVEAHLAAQAADAYRRYQTALQTVLRYDQQILPKSRRSVELTQRLYEQGEIDFLRLLQTQRTLNEVNLAYIDAQQARWTAAADIAGLLQLDEFP